MSWTVWADRTALERCVAGVSECDGYVTVVVDPATGAVDAHGPHSGPAVIGDADRRRRELDAAYLDDVIVAVVRLHHPPTH